MSIVEHPFPVCSCVPPHLHTNEDEYSIVLEGDIGFRSGDREVVLGSGGYITKPRGETHAMWNAGKVPARMIEVISPCWLRALLLGGEGGGGTRAARPEVIAELARQHGLEMGNAPWLDDVIARYNLTPPRGAA